MSASAADLALQTVMYNALVAAGGLTALLGSGADSIFDAVPDGAVLPFVVIGDNELTLGELKTGERWQGKVTVDVRTQQGEGPGTPQPPLEQAKLILEQVQAVVTDSLAPAGYVIIVLSVDFLGADVDPGDHKSVRGRVTYNLDMVEG